MSTDAAEPKLHVVFLGGDLAPGRLGEDHEVVLVVADDIPGARAAAKAKWTGVGKAHIDAVRPLDVVDGHRIRLEPTSEDEANVVDPTYEAAEAP
jgi:hypothetical protein